MKGVLKRMLRMAMEATAILLVVVVAGTVGWIFMVAGIGGMFNVLAIPGRNLFSSAWHTPELFNAGLAGVVVAEAVATAMIVGTFRQSQSRQTV